MIIITIILCLYFSSVVLCFLFPPVSISNCLLHLTFNLYMLGCPLSEHGVLSLTLSRDKRLSVFFSVSWFMFRSHLQVDALRVRLEEKELFLTKKTKQLQDLTDEKSTLTGEIRDLKDMLDVKERKVNVLQKKVGPSVAWQVDRAKVQYISSKCVRTCHVVNHKS